MDPLVQRGAPAPGTGLSEPPRNTRPTKQLTWLDSEGALHRLFADHKGSMELLADEDPEEARRILDVICRTQTVTASEADASEPKLLSRDEHDHPIWRLHSAAAVGSMIRA